MKLSASLTDIKVVLLDIEGTISDINFVKNVLFPYSEKHMRSYIEANFKNAVVQDVLRWTEQPTTEKAIQQLLTWIKQDVKHPALKTIQGLIWKQGFESGEFRSELYPEVLPTLKAWKNKGLRLAIYSSGSRQAQDLFFKHTTEGNVLSLFEAQFDLSLGPKLEADSYKKISSELNMLPQSILFFSDNPLELDAATTAGMKTFEVLRDATTAPSGRHPHGDQISIDG